MSDAALAPRARDHGADCSGSHAGAVLEAGPAFHLDVRRVAADAALRHILRKTTMNEEAASESPKS